MEGRHDSGVHDTVPEGHDSGARPDQVEGHDSGAQRWRGPGRSPGRRRRAILGATVGLLLSLAPGCGGPDAESPSTGPEPETLFAGPAGHLRPHETGRTTRFIVRAESAGETRTSVLTSRVLHEGPDGEFVAESATDGGPAHRVRVRDTGDRLEIEATARRTPDGFSWRELDPPAVVVRTPVFAGDGFETTFERSVDALVETEESSQIRTITFEGRAVRTPRSWEAIVVDGRPLDAIAFDIRATSETARLPELSGRALDPSFRLRLAGTEHLVPGLGLVRESAALDISVGGRTARIDLLSERQFD